LAPTPMQENYIEHTGPFLCIRVYICTRICLRRYSRDRHRQQYSRTTLSISVATERSSSGSMAAGSSRAGPECRLQNPVRIFMCVYLCAHVCMHVYIIRECMCVHACFLKRVSVSFCSHVCVCVRESVYTNVRARARARVCVRADCNLRYTRPEYAPKAFCAHGYRKL
jgi:hypothetical protein